jgi:hypothetical protein
MCILFAEHLLSLKASVTVLLFLPDPRPALKGENRPWFNCVWRPEFE